MIHLKIKIMINLNYKNLMMKLIIIMIYFEIMDYQLIIEIVGMLAKKHNK